MIFVAILAGGIGSRMGDTDTPKQFLDLGDRPILIHTIEKFVIIDEIDEVIVLTPQNFINHTKYLIEEYIPNNDKVVVIEGGETRNDTLKNSIDYINENDINANIIYIDFNLDMYDDLKQYKDLIEYVSSKYNKTKNNFILIDEVQMCDGFEKAINNFHAEAKYDIYITGSNAFLLSSDLATLFTGRTYSIEVYPFSYKEFLSYHNLDNNEESYDRYVLEGGFSGSYLYKELDKKYNYIGDVYKTLIVRDIITRNKIQNIPLLDSISDFLIDNISRLTSYRSLTDTLNNDKNNINDKTVGTYIKYLCEAFAFYRIRRYDIQGKKYLATQDKYYLSDHAVKYAIQGTKNMNYGSMYENIVAIELLRRGYEVYVGVLHEKEIDFVATKRNEKIYIQVSSDIGDDFDNDTFRREVDPLLKIKDAYPKMIIARTKHDDYQYEGIQIVDIANWLAKEN